MRVMTLLCLAALSVASTCAAEPDFVKHPVRVLYLGDSLSDFDRGSNHVDRLQAKLDALSPRCASIYNYAVRGDYIERMVERFRGGTNCTSRTAYHGIWGFREFTHPSTVLWGSTRFNLPLREHPYTDKKLKILKSVEK